MEPFFQPNKIVVISYKQQFETVYNISSMQVATRGYHKDLGIVFSRHVLGPSIQTYVIKGIQNTRSST